MEWADAVEWKAIRSLAGEDVALRDKVHHLHVVQRAFFAIWNAHSADLNDLFASRDLIALQSWAREYHAQVTPFIAGLKHEDLSRKVHLPWAERFGQRAEDPMLGETMIQVAMHSQYHRGQINTRLRELGAEPRWSTNRLDLVRE